MKPKSIFSIGLLVIGLVAVFLLYRLFFVNDGAEVTPGVEVENVIDSELARSNDEFIVILNSLERIKLESEILTSQVFQSLHDFSVPLVPEPKGRNNPFLPIGLGGAPPTATTSGQIR